jgi:glycerol-3-phosphate dehydrogenase (NAD(P)+)
MSGTISTIGVVGGGAWGTALAAAAVRAGCDVLLWARDRATVETVNRDHQNTTRLPGIRLDESLRATCDLEEAVARDAVILAVPAQTVRDVAAAMSGAIAAGVPVVLAAKGLERATDCFLSDAVAKVLPTARPAVLSGPSFASDVARGLPTAVTLACEDEETGRALVHALGHPQFRPYRSDDMVGTQIGGAVKNVLAIACGTVEGRALGRSALAALVARGFAEMSRFGLALGARTETLAGLSGLGDLVLTATSTQSRNFSFGIELGRGGSADAILGGRASVTEGVWTVPAVVRRAAALGVEMPICAAVEAVVEGRIDVDAAIEGLLSRPFREEG